MSKTYRDRKRWQLKNLPDEELDRLPWPPWAENGMSSWYKTYRRRLRRTQVKQAMREGKEPPRFRTTDLYDFW